MSLRLAWSTHSARAARTTLGDCLKQKQNKKQNKNPSKTKPGEVVHSFNSSSLVQRQKDLYEFQVRLVYVVPGQSVLQGKTLSQKQKTNLA